MSLCKICGEGNAHLRCEIHKEAINNYEYQNWIMQDRLHCDLPLYFNECDACGICVATSEQMQVNHTLWIFARREHGLPDSIFKRGWKYE